MKASILSLLVFAAAVQAQSPTIGVSNLRPTGQPVLGRQITASYDKPPLHFEANQGQAGDRVKFLAQGNGYNLSLTSSEIVLELRAWNFRLGNKRAKPQSGRFGASGPKSVALHLKLLGANPFPLMEGVEPLTGKSNYFLGNDPRQWFTDLPHYARVRYHDVYPGIDLVFYGNPHELEYDWIVSAGAQPTNIRLGFQGAERIVIYPQGDLVLHTKLGPVVQRKPLVYQEVDGRRQEIPGGYVLEGKNQVGFEVAAYDARKPLIIDPTTSFFSYLGGSGSDTVTGMAVDASGNLYLTGVTNSPNFPVTGGIQAAGGGGRDAFVMKLAPGASTRIWSTYLGGSGDDVANAIAVDASGNVYVTGVTSSSNFPSATPLQAARGGATDAFVAKLNAAGNALVYSTYLGGSLDD